MVVTSQHMTSTQATVHLGVLLLLLLTTGLYWLGLNGDFLFDDIPNIVNKPALHLDRPQIDDLIDAALAGHAGPLGRPIAYLSFALDHWRGGLDPTVFKQTNIAIHLINGLLVFALARALLAALQPYARHGRSEATALLTAAIWLLHPLNLSPVLYVVQRMTSLATLFVFSGVLAYVYGRRRGGLVGATWVLSAYAVFLPLAALSKENGLLLPVLLAVVELFCLRGQGSVRMRRLTMALHSVFFLLPLAVLLLYTVIRPEWISGGYVNRDFSLEERLLTQTRVLWFYVSLLVLPDISRMGLFHEFTLSSTLFSPWTTLPALLAWCAALGWAWWSRQRQPLFAFAIVWFLSGHAMESTVIALELVHEHRNYLPTFGPIFAIAAVLINWADKPGWRRKTMVSIMVLALAAATAVRARIWGDTPAQMLVEAQNHPGSVSAQYEAARLLFNLSMRMPPQQRERTLMQTREMFERLAAREDGEAVLGLFPLIIAETTQATPNDPEPLLRSLREVLRTRPQPAIVSDYLDAIGRCQQLRHCRLDKDQVWSLFEAAMANPRAVGYRGSLIRIQAARYAWYARADYRRAVELAAKAADDYPANGCHRLDQIQMLDALGAHIDARRLLDIAKRAGLYGCGQDVRDLERKWANGSRIEQD